MTRVALAAVLAICLGACGRGRERLDDSSGSSSDRQADPPSAPSKPDRPRDLTGFVTDLIDQRTSDDALPVAEEQFASLQDPDDAANNLDAYASMFRASPPMISSPDK